jgi:hypothetical protein
MDNTKCGNIKSRLYFNFEVKNKDFFFNKICKVKIQYCTLKGLDLNAIDSATQYSVCSKVGLQ